MKPSEKYFPESGFVLYRGDCIEILKTIEDDSVDVIFADPPYNLSNGGITCQGGKMVSVNKGTWDESKGAEIDFEFHRSWLSECRRVLKPDGTIWVSGTYHSIYSCGFAMQLLGYHFLNDIAWFKSNASPNLIGRFFAASHETSIWARKSRTAKHYFDYETMKSVGDREDFLKARDKQMRSVWAISPPAKDEKASGKHPTQKPEKLLSRIITASTRPGDSVLHPFNGSGTTGITAYKLGRSYIGIDSDASYLTMTVKRFKSTRAGSGGLFQETE